MASSPILTNPTLRALVAIALFTYTAQNTINVSIAPLSRALMLPEWIVGGAVSLAAIMVTALSQFWGRRSFSWGRRRVLLVALTLAFIAGSLFSLTVWARVAGFLGVALASAGIMVARGGFFGAAVAAIPPTGQALVAQTTPDEASRVRGMSAFSGAINLSVMCGSLISALLGAWWVFAPVHATPWFIVVAWLIAFFYVPHDNVSHPKSHFHDRGTSHSSQTAASQENPPQLPPRIAWTDRRIIPWCSGIFGLFFASGIVQILMGFIVQDRGGFSPEHAIPLTGLMLLFNAAGAMLFQLFLVPRLSWPPARLLRTGVTVGMGAFILLACAPSMPVVAAATFLMGVSSGLAVPGFSAGASLAVTDSEQGGVAGIINATGALTWIFAPVSAASLYSYSLSAPFILGAGLICVSCLITWFHPRIARLSEQNREAHRR